MLRLSAKRDAKRLSCLHNQEHTQHANTLHRLGEKLSFPVCVDLSSFRGFKKSHCISALFGVDDEQDALELDKAAQAGENRRTNF